MDSLENETDDNLFLSQDIKPKPKAESEQKRESSNLNAHVKIFPLPAKRHLSEADKTTTAVCENEQKVRKMTLNFCVNFLNI